MNALDAHLRALGLADARVEPLNTLPLPADGAGQGLAIEPATDARELVASFPFFSPIEAALPGDARLLGADRHPGIYILEGGAPGVVIAGRWEQVSEGERLIDARETPATVLAPAGGQLLGLHLSGRAVERLSLTPRVTPDPVERPPLEALLGGRAAADWLRELWTRTPATDLVAVGTLGRLWSPPRGAPRDPVPEASTGPWPMAAALEFGRGLAEPVRAQLAREGIARAQDLERALEALSARVAEDPDSAGTELVAWLRARDDLASRALLLRGSSGERALADAVERLDATAMTHLSALAWPEAPHDDQLAAVATSEPEAWWGTLAFGAVSPRPRAAHR